MVRLESVQISRFRGIREGTVDGFADVNLLIGRNNSGKSTVAEAITWAAQDIGAVDPLGRESMAAWHKARRFKGDLELWYRQDQTEDVSVTLSVGGVTIVRRDGNDPEKSTEPRIRGQHPVCEYIRRLTVFRPMDGQDPAIEQALWPKLLSDRSDKALTRMLNEIFNLDSEGFQLLPDQRLLVMFPEYSVPVDAQGDGTRSAIRCLMMLAALKSTLFIIEEPESHQHPGSLERFARAVCQQAKNQDVQLLISTHSSECVRSFLDAAEEASSESAVFHFKLDDGLLEAHRLDAEAVETLQETGVDVRYLDLYA